MPGSEWVAPTITGLIGLLVVTITIVSAARNRRKGAIEQRAPDVTEAWSAAERARDRMFTFQDLFYTVKGSFKSYARRMAHLHGDAAALNPEEHAALEKQPPADAVR